MPKFFVFAVRSASIARLRFRDPLNSRQTERANFSYALPAKNNGSPGFPVSQKVGQSAHQW
jgi:hypothetical protein